jgi:hypothetical protein
VVDRGENSTHDQACVQRSAQHRAVRQRAPEASPLATDHEPGAWGHAAMAPHAQRVSAHPYSPGSIAHNCIFTIGLASPGIEC